MSGFLLGLLVGAWSVFLLGLLFLAAWMNITRAVRCDDRIVVSRRCECGLFSSGTGTVLHIPGCPQESPVRQAFL